MIATQPFEPGSTTSKAGIGHQHLTMNRPASAPVESIGMTEEEEVMWEELQFVSFKDLQEAMCRANIPGAKSKNWKLDLISLAVLLKFKYKVASKRLLKQFAAIPVQLPPPHTTNAPPPPTPASVQLPLTPPLPPGPAVHTPPKRSRLQTTAQAPADFFEPGIVPQTQPRSSLLMVSFNP